MKVTLAQAKSMMARFSVDPLFISPSLFRKAMNIELEHGRRHRATNVTGDSLIKTAQIVIAHLLESPRYYQELIKMEKKLGI